MSASADVNLRPTSARAWATLRRSWRHHSRGVALVLRPLRRALFYLRLQCFVRRDVQLAKMLSERFDLFGGQPSRVQRGLAVRFASHGPIAQRISCARIPPDEAGTWDPKFSAEVCPWKVPTPADRSPPGERQGAAIATAQRYPTFGRGVPKTVIAPTTSSQNGSTPTPGIASRTNPGKSNHRQPSTTNNSAAVRDVCPRGAPATQDVLRLLAALSVASNCLS